MLPSASRGRGHAPLQLAPARIGWMTVLLNGVNHVAVLTGDTERFHAFYRDVFDAKVSGETSAEGEGVRLSFVDIGPFSELNVFEVRDNTEAEEQTPISAPVRTRP